MLVTCFENEFLVWQGKRILLQELGFGALPDFVQMLSATDVLSPDAAFGIIDTEYTGVGKPMSTDTNGVLNGLNITIFS